MTKRVATIICAFAVAAYALLLFSSFGKPEGWLRDDKGVSQLTDYISLWSAGRLAQGDEPAAAYDWFRHAETMSAELQVKTDPFPFPYPPTFLVVMKWFAALPYVPSMLVFGLVTLALYAGVMARITGTWIGTVWMCAPLATMLNFYAGQNGFVTAALMGAGLLLLPCRPILAGVAIGLLTIKPHLGLLLPLALAVSGNWRAFIAAGVTAVAIAVGSVAVLGPEPWPAFVASMSQLGAAVASTEHDSPFKFQSVYGMLATLGVPRGGAMAIHVIVALGVALFVADAWRRSLPFELKAAMLAAATPLLSPYVFIYDLTMQGVAAAFLVRYWLSVGADPGRVLMLASALMTCALFYTTGLPMGVVAGAALMAVVLRECLPLYREVLAQFRLRLAARSVAPR